MLVYYRRENEFSTNCVNVSMTAMFRPAASFLSSTFMRKHLSRYVITLSSSTLALMNMSLHSLTQFNSWQSFLMLLQDQTSTLMRSDLMSLSHTSSASQSRSSSQLRQMTQRGPNLSTCPRIQTRFDRPRNSAALVNPASRNFSSTMHYPRNSSSSALPQIAFIDEP